MRFTCAVTQCARTWPQAAPRAHRGRLGAGTSAANAETLLSFRAWRSVMGIEWNPSRGATLGVEWEVQLIDHQTKQLRQEAGKLLADLPVIGDTGEHPQI